MLQEFLWSWGPYVINKGSDILNTLQSLYKVVYTELLVKKEFIFLKSHVIPVSSEMFKIENQDIKWRCQVNPGRFYQPGISNLKEKHLPYLGFLVKIPGSEIDLSSWINDVRYSGLEPPTLQEIFILWCCENGKSYFHCLDSIQVELVTEMGDIEVKGLNGSTNTSL